MVRLFSFLLCLFALSLPWSAAQAANCQVPSTLLPFDTYNPLDTFSNTVVTPLQVSCVASTTAEGKTGVITTLALVGGNTGVAFQRALQHGTERLDYNVYLHPSLQGVFGDGTGGTQTIPACFGSACATDASQTPSVATLYGAIPPNQDIDPGVYQDTLLIQVAF